MRIHRYSFIFTAITCFIVSAKATDPAVAAWIQHKNNFLSQLEPASEVLLFLNSSQADDLTLVQLIDALPAVEHWDSIVDLVEADLAKTMQSPTKAALVEQLILNMLRYLNTPIAAQELTILNNEFETKALVQPMLESSSNFTKSNRLTKILDQLPAYGDPSGGNPANGIVQLENFIQSLERLKPMTEAEMIEYVGGQKNFDLLKDYTIESQSVFADIEKRYADYFSQIKQGRAPDSEIEQVLQAEYLSFQTKHREALILLGKLHSDPEAAEIIESLVNDIEDHSTADDRQYHYIENLNVPDLVTIAGRETASELLVQALELKVMLCIENAQETFNLASALALKHIDSIRVPQWKLCQSVNRIELFKALSQKFPQKSDNGQISDEVFYSNSEYYQAKSYHAINLLLNGGTDQTLSILDRLPDNAINEYELSKTLAQNGNADAAFELLKDLLLKQPSKHAWTLFFTLSAELNRNHEMLTFVTEQIDPTAMPLEQQLSAYIVLARSKLSVGAIEDAIAYYLKIFALADSLPSASLDDMMSAVESALELALVTKNMPLQEQCLATFDKLFELLQNDNVDVNRNDLTVAMINALIECVNFDRAAELAESEIKRLSLLNEQSSSFYFKDYELTKISELKVILLVAQQKYEEALEFLQTSPNWLAADLGEYFRFHPYSDLIESLPLILAQNQKKEKAVTVLKAILPKHYGNDSHYQLLVELEGMAAIPCFDKLYSYDPFEERPLIWKAHLLAQDGQLDAAQQFAEQAIAIDPSDGEQGKGDRMRVYAVMRDIYTARGNLEKSAFFNDVLKAIRLSEDADDYFEVGLNQQAIAMYAEALGFFADAYCIQSRLALQLSKDGQHEAAAIHYESAYTLMPDSFGRIESHCFGCEGAFDGEQPQLIAERVFKAALEKDPEKPQIHYLLGYLYKKQGQNEKALDHFFQATKLDPLYLNAWKHLAELSDEMFFSEGLRDLVNRKLLELDPLGRHSYPEFSKLQDFKAAWLLLKRSERLQIETQIPEQLFSLHSSDNPSELLDISFSTTGIKTAGKRLLENPTLERYAELVEIALEL